MFGNVNYLPRQPVSILLWFCNFLYFQDGRAPVHLAAHNGYSESLSALIQAKADVNLASNVLFT